MSNMYFLCPKKHGTYESALTSPRPNHLIFASFLVQISAYELMLWVRNIALIISEVPEWYNFTNGPLCQKSPRIPRSLRCRVKLGAPTMVHLAFRHGANRQDQPTRFRLQSRIDIDKQHDARKQFWKSWIKNAVEPFGISELSVWRIVENLRPRFPVQGKPKCIVNRKTTAGHQRFLWNLLNQNFHRYHSESGGQFEKLPICCRFRNPLWTGNSNKKVHGSTKDGSIRAYRRGGKSEFFGGYLITPSAVTEN